MRVLPPMETRGLGKDSLEELVQSTRCTHSSTSSASSCPSLLQGGDGDDLAKYEVGGKERIGGGAIGGEGAGRGGGGGGRRGAR